MDPAGKGMMNTHRSRQFVIYKYSRSKDVQCLPSRLVLPHDMKLEGPDDSVSSGSLSH
jgi:hypothetical protein